MEQVEFIDMGDKKERKILRNRKGEIKTMEEDTQETRGKEEVNQNVRNRCGRSSRIGHVLDEGQNEILHE